MYYMETYKVVDFEQLICRGTKNKASEVELADLGELPILH